MAIPSFLLKKLYVKGSLKSTDEGFEFVLCNTLAPGSIIGLGPVILDDASIPPANIKIQSPQGEWQGDQISSRNPVTFPMNVETKIVVKGTPPAPGPHHVVLAVLTREVGRLDIDLTDSL